MNTLLRSGLSAGLCAALLAGAQMDVRSGPASPEVAVSDVALAATVLTLEGGIVGLQHVFHFTPRQLQGDLCQAPNRCEPVDYFAMPLGQPFNDLGAVTLNTAIDALPADGTPITLFGHSQGGQVIYSALRGWAADPAGAPDPSRVSWVSIGNPENTFGGRDPDPIPADSPYQGIEVIRQYDGWADWPTTFNLVAWANAVAGMQLVHPNYFNVDINDPNNVRYVEGNVTYVFVPNPVLPLVQLTGVFAPLLNPVLDPILRPIVESAYQRPGGIGAVGTGAVSVAPPAATLSPVSARTASQGAVVPVGKRLRGAVDGGDDALVSGAAAEVAGQALPDLGVGGAGVLAQQSGDRHDEAGSAEAALKSVTLPKRRLHR